MLVAAPKTYEYLTIFHSSKSDLSKILERWQRPQRPDYVQRTINQTNEIDMEHPGRDVIDYVDNASLTGPP